MLLPLLRRVFRLMFQALDVVVDHVAVALVLIVHLPNNVFRRGKRKDDSDKRQQRINSDQRDDNLVIHLMQL